MLGNEYNGAGHRSCGHAEHDLGGALRHTNLPQSLLARRPKPMVNKGPRAFGSVSRMKSLSGVPKRPVSAILEPRRLIAAVSPALRVRWQTNEEWRHLTGPRSCPECGRQYPAETRFCTQDGQALREQRPASDRLIGQRIDKFIVDSLIGAGGMGVVYLATQTTLDRKVALKVLRPGSGTDSAAVARFRREARNVAQIQHPAVVTIYDFGVDVEDRLYLAMEYVPGTSLGQILAEEGFLSLDRTATILLKVAAGLAAAHALDIVHRDLKPENILVADKADGTVDVKIIDFGISRAILEAGQTVTAQGGFVGTPAYMSPEQIAGSAVDFRSDVYSLAIVACVLLTGERPFDSDTVNLRLRELDSPRTLEELMPGTSWPASVQRVLDRALSPIPAHRHDSVTAFVVELVDALHGWQPERVPAVTGSFARVEDSGAHAQPLPQQVTGPSRVRARSRSKRALWTVAIATVLTASVTALAIEARRLAQGRVGVAPESSRMPIPLIAAETLLSPVPVSSADAAGQQFSSTPRPTQATAPLRLKRDVRSNTSSVPSETPSSALIDTVLTDSSQNAPVLTPPPELPEPLIRIGAPASASPELLVNDQSRGTLRQLRAITVPVGVVRLRLRLPFCQDWDTTLNASRGDTLLVGIRRPTCRQ